MTQHTITLTDEQLDNVTDGLSCLLNEEGNHTPTEKAELQTLYTWLLMRRRNDGD